MQCMDIQPDKGDWEKSFDPSTRFDSMVAIGRHVANYDILQNKKYAEAKAYPIEFEGHKGWAINNALTSSLIFEGLDDRPLWILFSYKAGIWKYSLRCAPGSGIDVSMIASKYNGGGHAAAASFQSDKYLLKDII